VDAVDVRSKLHEITVANHIHVLHASNGSKTDTAVLNKAFPTAELRFRPAPASELATRAFIAGALKTVTGWTQLLFLLGLVMAARSRPELYRMAAAFLTTEIAAALIIPLTASAPSPRFVEAACALTAGYLALEILFLPDSGHRAVVVGVLGLFHGMYFADSSGFALAGAVLVEVVFILLFFALIRRSGDRALRFASGALLVTSIAWFAKGLGG
jgi:hypothetical protein